MFQTKLKSKFRNSLWTGSDPNPLPWPSLHIMIHDEESMTPTRVPTKQGIIIIIHDHTIKQGNTNFIIIFHHLQSEFWLQNMVWLNANNISILPLYRFRPNQISKNWPPNGLELPSAPPSPHLSLLTPLQQGGAELSDIIPKNYSLVNTYSIASFNYTLWNNIHIFTLDLNMINHRWSIHF